MDWSMWGLLMLSAGLCTLAGFLGWQYGRVDQHVNRRPIRWKKLLRQARAAKAYREDLRKKDRTAASRDLRRMLGG